MSGSFFESDEFFLSSLHILAVIALPVHTFGAYVILFKTPTTMQTVKWCLFTLHCWSALLDMYISILGTFVILFPAPMGYPLGLLTHFGVPSSLIVYLLISLMAIVTVSIMETFENRYYTTVKNQSNGIFESPRRTFILISNYLLAFLFMLPSVLNSPDPEKGFQFYRNLYPYYSDGIYNRTHFYVLHLDWKVPFISLTIPTIVYIIEIAFLILSTFIFMARENSRLSEKTRKYQKKFLISLSLQLTVPVLSILAPVIYAFIGLSLGVFNQAANLIVFIVLGSHGTVSTIMMLFLHKPYREATFLFINPSLQRKTSIISISAVTLGKSRFTRRSLPQRAH